MFPMVVKEFGKAFMGDRMSLAASLIAGVYADAVEEVAACLPYVWIVLLAGCFKAGLNHWGDTSLVWSLVIILDANKISLSPLTGEVVLWDYLLLLP